MGVRLLAGALLLLSAGCGFSDPATATGDQAITGGEFIEAYVALRQAARGAQTPETFEQAKREILSRHGIRAEEMLEFAETRGSDLKGMQAIWDSIDARLTSVATDSIR